MWFIVPAGGGAPLYSKSLCCPALAPFFPEILLLAKASVIIFP
jgi:hypothetical protein